MRTLSERRGYLRCLKTRRPVVGKLLRTNIIQTIFVAEWQHDFIPKWGTEIQEFRS